MPWRVVDHAAHGFEGVGGVGAVQGWAILWGYMIELLIFALKAKTNQRSNNARDV